jgi:POT family proton-dependent oligopeptide transporter
LGEAGKNPTPEAPAAARRSRRILAFGLGGFLGLVLVIAALAAAGIITVTPEAVGGVFGYVLALTPLILFPSLYFLGGFNRQEKKQLIVIMALFFGAAVFWSVFEQAGSTLNLFADRSTDTTISFPLAAVIGLVLLVPAYLSVRWVLRIQTRSPLAVGFAALVVLAVAAGVAYLFTHLGEPFPSSYFQSTNALFIVALAPLFATLWTTWGGRGPSHPAKFAAGLFFVALGFGILIVAARLSANGVQVSPLWLTATYLIHTVGELCLSPVGMSAMTRLAPQRIVGLVLGIWFLATSLGNFMAGFAASLYESMPLPALFTAVTGVGLAATVVMAVTVGPIRRMLARP